MEYKQIVFLFKFFVVNFLRNVLIIRVLSYCFLRLKIFTLSTRLFSEDSLAAIFSTSDFSEVADPANCVVHWTVGPVHVLFSSSMLPFASL